MKLMTAKEVAQIIGASPKTVYQWAEEGLIPHYKVNGLLRFDLDEMLGWIGACHRSATSGYNSFAKTVTSSPRKGGK
jgi:excisionase family DNA binding protein